jgi:RimJ/RimL family protein N-acetyltransferase
MTLRTSAALPGIALRPIRPDDKHLLVAGLGRLSERSRYQRFLSAKPRLSPSELRYLTEVDHVDHVALVAVLAASPATLIGVGRWVRDTEHPNEAEIAIAVADELQGRGVGTTIGRALADAALDRGIVRFTATMLPDNVAAHRLFEKISEHLAITRAYGVDELVAELAAA